MRQCQKIAAEAAAAVPFGRSVVPFFRSFFIYFFKFLINPETADMSQPNPIIVKTIFQPIPLLKTKINVYNAKILMGIAIPYRIKFSFLIFSLFIHSCSLQVWFPASFPPAANRRLSPLQSTCHESISKCCPYWNNYKIADDIKQRKIISI